MRGVLRSLAVTAAGVGLVLGAGQLTDPVNLAPKAGPGAVTAGRTAPVAQAQSICPGPGTLGVVGQKDPLPRNVSVVAATAPVQALPRGFFTEGSLGSLTISGLPRGGPDIPPVTMRGYVASTEFAAPESPVIVGAGVLAPGTVATQRSWVRDGESRGLLTAVCVQATGSSWLIAGGAEPGRRERLVLANPGPKPVTVDLVVLGVKGAIQSPNGHGLVVGPYARSVVLLDAIAGSEPSPVVHVIARGGEVAAVLSDTWLDGVVPRGGDDAVPVAGPAREQTIAGLQVGGGRATLRVAVPGDRDAVVECRVLSPSGPKALPANGVTHLTAHTSTDIDLSALPPDAYAVQVRADVPVVSAAMTERRTTPGGLSDLAWSSAVAPVSTLAGLALREPEEKSLLRRLDLAATNDPASVQVTTVGDDGQVRIKEVALAADSVSTMALDGAASVWVTPRTGTVRAAVVTWFTDKYGMLISVTPMPNLTLTATTPPLKELRD